MSSPEEIIEKLLPDKNERVELELGMAKKYITRAALLHGSIDIDDVSREMLAAMASLTRAQEVLRGMLKHEPGSDG